MHYSAGTFSEIQTYSACFLQSKLDNANIHGRSQSVQFYATSNTISGTKFGPETHIASPINATTQIFHYLSK